MTEDLVQVKEQSAHITFTPTQVDLIKTQFCQGASDDELKLFMAVCERRQLDPFAKQIYGIMRWNKAAKKKTLTIQTSIDGFRLIAQRSNQYQGQDGPAWCGPDGKWVEVWLRKEPPRAARVGVMRQGFFQPLYRVAHWNEYAQTNAEGQLTGQWATMPSLMLGKVAEALALRAAFPEELSGIYTNDEMDQAWKPVNVEVKDVSQGEEESGEYEQQLERLLSLYVARIKELNGQRSAAGKAPISFDAATVAQIFGIPEPEADKKYFSHPEGKKPIFQPKSNFVKTIEEALILWYPLLERGDCMKIEDHAAVISIYGARYESLLIGDTESLIHPVAEVKDPKPAGEPAEELDPFADE